MRVLCTLRYTRDFVLGTRKNEVRGEKPWPYTRTVFVLPAASCVFDAADGGAAAANAFTPPKRRGGQKKKQKLRADLCEKETKHVAHTVLTVVRYLPTYFTFYAPRVMLWGGNRGRSIFFL